MKLRRPRIGLVLGGGAARGWAHIGVIRALAERDIKPDLIVGTSVGAIVGGALAADRLDKFEHWVRHLRRMDIFRLLDARILGGGFLRGTVLMQALERVIGNPVIEALDLPFGCVATELGTGRELWLTEGPLLTACRASISLPGLFAPAVQDGGRYLLDGGLVNPVPVSLARNMGAEIVIAVNLNDEMVGHRFWHQGGAQQIATSPPPQDSPSKEELAEEGLEAHSEEGVAPLQGWGAKLKVGMGLRLDAYLRAAKPSEAPSPGLLDAILGSIDIMQDRLTRSRMVGEPPDIHITPRVKHVALMDFDRAGECIPAGELAVARKDFELDQLRDIIKSGSYLSE